MTAPRQRGLATLFTVLTLLAIASLALIAASRQLLLAHANAQNQHRYHQALDYAEEGLNQAQAALAAGAPLLDTPRYQLKRTDIAPDLVRLASTGLYDQHRVTVQRMLRLGRAGGDSPVALAIVGDLDLSGAVNLLSDKPVDMTVDGKVRLSGSVNGIGTLQSTGDIFVSGPQTIGILHSNGNIELANGSYQTVTAVGDLTLRGDAAVARLARVNGNARFFSSPGAEPAVRAAEVKGDVEINMGGARFGRLDTEGKVDIRQFGGMEALQALGDLSIQGWGAPLSGVVAGRANFNANNPEIRVNQDPKLHLKLEPVPLLQVGRPRIDAFNFKNEAHYRFEFDRAGRILVTVRKIHGLADGAYRLGLSPDSQLPNYLCRDADSQGRCKAGAPAQLICKGHSPQNDCFAGSRPGHWKLDGQTMAPGVLWFDGDLEVGSGVYHNSFLSSGDIATSGQHVSYAVNYAGAVGICRNSDFPALYPEDDCRQGLFKGRPIGNAALLAGGYSAGRYQGGNITLGASSQIHGNVWAGNMLFSGGSTTIHGYVAAALQGAASAAEPHRWGASTTIDLRDLPETFQPGSQPGDPGSSGKRGVEALPYSWMDSGADS
ncbi:hypothetical protein KIF53_14690 [Chromobacterium subtsugae]|uniref:DUF342 domain-containing protein n=1 Tax=Chromobacterium subtsugae TaxID=251747 RepID=A0ABS7FFW2_9NEIS|nr:MULTISPECIES: hypothetical protein [Chromobacterium]KUM04610.1 hypothetical protein Cv017_13530 [Chromobacterium subtsugae]KZE86398.1 hypothetical protein AWB61_15450 [Chromobacterium sp. F49]MBW7567655.1 hypothetical protein [Chromobacterium subtsugae]MBW8288881.1 hypothetical protein [Chromobacterium subtsugae]WSE91326.1 hypothetical protein U6115_21000 [Chromobacterium subtsugae]